MSDYYAKHAIRGQHIQTMMRMGIKFRPVPLIRQRLELHDGDFIDLDWSHCTKPTAIVVILSGLTGNSRSHYVQQLIKCLNNKQWSCVALNHRGTSGESNRLVTSYHSGKTDDLETVIDRVRRRYPHLPVYGVGYSLGGNVLLKYLGERHNNANLDAAVAISVPYKLAECADALNQGFCRLYQRHLIDGLKRSIKGKCSLGLIIPQLDKILSSKNFWSFDQNYTAMVHGFADVHDYYKRSSCYSFIQQIGCPTVLIHAKDDPLVPASSIPQANDLPASVQMILWPHGGHVGFWGFKLGTGLKDCLSAQIEQALTTMT